MAKRFTQQFFISILCLLFATAIVSASEDNKPLKMGFFPIVSSIALFKRFTPLKSYLEEKIGQDIELETARDFKTFVARTARGDYDIVVTAPHFAVLAVDSGKYDVIASLKNDLVGLVVVNIDSGIFSIEGLQGKKVATPPKQAVISLVGRAYLDSNLAKPPKYRTYKSHNAAYEAVLGGDVDGAVVSVNVVNKLREIGIPLQQIASTPPLPNMATLVSRQLPAELKKKIQQVLVGMDKDPQGKETLKTISLPGYRPANNQTYETMRPYSEMVKFK